MLKYNLRTKNTNYFLFGWLIFLLLKVNFCHNIKRWHASFYLFVYGICRFMRATCKRMSIFVGSVVCNPLNFMLSSHRIPNTGKIYWWTCRLKIHDTDPSLEVLPWPSYTRKRCSEVKDIFSQQKTMTIVIKIIPLFFLCSGPHITNTDWNSLYLTKLFQEN